MKIYKLNDKGILTGEMREIEDGELIPEGWVSLDPTPITPAPAPVPLRSICPIVNGRLDFMNIEQQDMGTAIPEGWVSVNPVEEDLEQYINAPPPVPTPSRKTTYLRTEFIDAIDRAGLADSLGALLSQSPLIIREQWYANPAIDIADVRVVAFFQQAGVDLDKLFK